MRQETAAITQVHVTLLILFLVFVLAVAFLAVTSVQTIMPLPHEKTQVALFAKGLFTR